MERARILILHTGGTIGMQPSGAGLAPAAGFEALLRQRLAPQLAALPDFDLLELDPLIDSADLCPSHWTRIAAALQAHAADYAGFVITHGTDTLAYTAAALSFMCAGLDKPVVVTGSQIPLAAPRSDGVENLLGALQLAACAELVEVCVCFRGRVLRGNRAVKVHATALEAFDSPNAPWLGTIGIDLQLNHPLLLPAGMPAFDTASVTPAFDPAAVAVLRLYPGIQTGLVNALLGQPGLKALILQSYGVGNAPTANHSLIEALEAAIARGTLIVNLTQCAQGQVLGDTYATGAALARIGVLSGGDMTLEATFAKLHWLLAQGTTPAVIRDRMGQAMCGERTPD